MSKLMNKFGNAYVDPFPISLLVDFRIFCSVTYKITLRGNKSYAPHLMC